jgi:hypothetical protein
MFRFAVEYSTFLVEGMALNFLLIGGSEKRLHDLRDYMKDNLEMIKKAGIDGMRVKQLLAPGRSRRAMVARSTRSPNKQDG